jgi:hypothetical protein
MFRTVSQALHFSYVLEQYPPHAMSQMSSVIRTIKREMGVAEDSRTSTVDLSGLSPMEARHQCADIRAAVRAQLTTVEAHVLEARFSHDRETKRLAIAALTGYCLPMTTVSRDVVSALVWRHQAPPAERKRHWTFREIAASYEISEDKAERQSRIVERILRTLESAAMDGLRDRFENAGIVDQTHAIAA